MCIRDRASSRLPSGNRFWKNHFTLSPSNAPGCSGKCGESRNEPGWAIQSSAQVQAQGEALSRPGFATAGWHRASVPATVVSALVADGTYPDPYYGTNLRKFPGVSYKVGTNFSNVAMPADSPFAVPWWYRTESVSYTHLTLPTIYSV